MIGKGKGILLDVRQEDRKSYEKILLVFATDKGLETRVSEWTPEAVIAQKREDTPLDLYIVKQVADCRKEDIRESEDFILIPPKGEELKWTMENRKTLRVAMRSPFTAHNIDGLKNRYHISLNNAKYENLYVLNSKLKFFSTYDLETMQVVEELPDKALERIIYMNEKVLPNLIIASIDIETVRTDGRLDFPEPGEAEIVITTYVIHDGNGKKLEEDIIISDVGSNFSHGEAVEKILEKHGVHFFAGHNVNHFDIPFLKFDGLEHDVLPFDTLKIAINHNRLLGGVPGSILDLKSICFHKKIISSAELPEIQRSNFIKEFTERRDQVIRYSVIDRRMTYSLVNETFKPAVMLASIMNIGLWSLISSATGTLAEFQVLKEAAKRSVVPMRQSNEDEKIYLDVETISYKAAYVMPAVPKIYKNVTCGDFAALYPSIILNENISPDTICCDHEECKKTKIEIVFYPNGDTDHERATEVWFCKKTKGIIPTILDNFIQSRHELKKILREENPPDIKKTAKVLDTSIKVPINSVYGFMGSHLDRHLTDSRCAAAVTGKERILIGEAIGKCIELGFEPIYGDTDSVYFNCKNEEKFDSKKAVADIGEHIANKFGKHYIFAWEKDAPLMAMFNKKKRYILIYEDGNTLIKGLDELVKKNTMPLVFRIALKEIYLRIAQKQNYKELIEDLENSMKQKKYVGWFKETLGREKIEPTDIVRQTRTNNPFTCKRFSRYGFLGAKMVLDISEDEYRRALKSENLRETWNRKYSNLINSPKLKLEFYEVNDNYYLIDEFTPDHLPRLEYIAKLKDYVKHAVDIWELESRQSKMGEWF